MVKSNGRGMKEILSSYCYTGIKAWQKIEKQEKIKQLQLVLYF